MGRKLDALFGRKFKTSKLKTTLRLAISRLSLLKNNRLARYTIARSDAIQLLRLNHHQQALFRVEQVIKDQNMLDVYDMIHAYCHLLIQRINLIEQVQNFHDCPGELREAVSDILYAAPRCGEFPELQEIRRILTSRFGKEFVNGAIELRKNCGVSQNMIQKLSTTQSLMELKMMTLTGIANENGIVLQLIPKEKAVEKTEKVSNLSVSMNGRKIYRDAEEAAQDAFESAAYAAAAARVAVELARSESVVSDSSDSDGSSYGNGFIYSGNGYNVSQVQQVNLENKESFGRTRGEYRQ